MARTDTLGNFLTDVADAIREKKGTEETILASDFDTEIENLPSGGGDVDEYFYTTLTQNTSMSRYGGVQIIKKAPSTIIVDDNVTSLAGMFYNYTQKVAPKVICNDNVTELYSMYQNSNITEIDTSGINTSNVKSFSSVFYSVPVTNLDISNFDMSKATNTGSMFRNDGLLTNLVLPSSLDISKVTNIDYMFDGCSSLISLDLSNWGAYSGQYFQAVFSGCTALETLSLNNLTTPNATSIGSSFLGCRSLQSLDISKWQTPKVTNMNSLFQNCTSLIHLDIRSFTFDKVTAYSNMFGTSALNGVPDNCEIIVADNTQKTWINTNFSRLTNVKTVAEYEAEQNA